MDIITTPFRRKDGSFFKKLKVIRQLFNSYIICTFLSDLFIVDQHAAHERVHYEKIKQTYNNSSLVTIQYLLSPITINLSKSRERSKVLRNLQTIQKFGIKGEFNGETDFVINAIPTFNHRHILPSVLKNIKKILLHIEDQWLIEERIIQLLACHSSIRGNTPLKTKQMNNLLSQLANVKNPWRCPHGRPIIRKLLKNPNIAVKRRTKKQINKEFKRN